MVDWNRTAEGPEADRQRWASIDAIFDHALDQPRERRAAWLADACQGDEVLEGRVRELLHLAETDDGTLEPQGALTGEVWEEVAEELQGGDKRSVFRPGDVVGTYTILRSLGTGGMGQVYSAEDSKLGRDVALKVLPPQMNLPEHRKRFEREAKAVAALDHPNIVQVYSIQEDDGVHFITMELVSGHTLGELIPASGMEPGDLLQIASEMAGAIGAAHEKGIVHRDLKPANVMITDDGRVKVLDFGLAKPASGLAGLRPDDVAAGETTGDGVILGTASYMSPEQAEGRDLDHRSDIFSFGVLLYQMATGELPFRGDTPVAIISSILRDIPSEVTELRPQLPEDLSRIIKKCLGKKPSRRYPSMRDLRRDLDELHYRHDSKPLFQVASPRGAGTVLPIATGVLAFLLLVTGYYALRARARENIVPSPPSFTELAASPDEETFPALSPDGRFVSYASRASGNWDVYLQRAGGQTPINLTENSRDDETQPAFSPDGERIAFRSTRAGGGVYVMGATGESPRRVVDFGWNPAWSPDGRRIVVATESISRHPFDRPTTSELWLVDVVSGEKQRLTEGDAVQPSWSPTGARIAYWGLARGTGQRDLWTMSSSGGEPRRVTDDAAVDWNPVWGPAGDELFFASDRGGSMNLWRVSLDPTTGMRRGEPEPLTVPASFASHISLARDGRRLAYASSSIEHRLYAIDFDPGTLTVTGEPRPIVRDLRDVDSPSPSPSGDRLVFSRTGKQEDILTSGSDGVQWRQLTDDPARDRRPVFSPDGTRIAFYSNRGGSYEIWIMGFDGSNLRALTDMKDHNLRYPFWSPDGSRLGFSYPGTSGIIVDVATPWGEQDPMELPHYSEEGAHFVPVGWSPDGEFIGGYVLTAAGLRAGIVTLELSTGRYEKLTDFGYFPTWTADSAHLVFMAADAPVTDGAPGYLQNHELFLVNRSTREYRRLFGRAGQSLEMPALSNDNRTLYYVGTTFESDIWLMSLDPAGPRPSS